MAESGLPAPFIAAAMDLAWQEQGAYELMELWSERKPGKERDEIVADLQEAVEDWAEAPPNPALKPRVAFDQLGGIVRSVAAHKRRLRELIDRHGGVSAVARKSGIPQPSLSRLLSSASMPRRSTLYRIANALGVEESEIVTKWVR
jgi:DNA-binding phage protein